MSENQVFSEVYKSAAKWHCDCAVVYFMDGERRFSAIASKKIGNAVKRNRTKRLLRAAFYNQQNLLKDGTFIIIAKKQIENMSFKEIERSLRWAFKKIGSIK
ncbi:ribonuclease P protein component [Campylobacter sp. JMF_01 NE2]|uniref:ribonuclease P protein component n=1 Tax=unclassified Campylobacter TaxID=2593542 RepID=UPI0022E9A8EC|nr:MULTISPECIES: ribonuclease P protein component [unclassified Campylobacter]MDA3042560.1 ribonuclease P protein component [Campylobacter sp. JMF_09 ED2]MDA3044626.1 ribonuclease P protein component [Campylobacter sp. JMF_07 ED4]MDA3046280.1 ribonuclease P protein component [Campylobacter sp. VBCF_06 NA8]MDA3047174.1 ribonuclease P protein component [Campylobacter sp. JMF_08 NE1]MDA3049054.1 ribonuclease P protein component [Campylobacter sp. JMF_15 NE4]